MTESVDDLDRRIDEAVREIMDRNPTFTGPEPGGTRDNITAVVREAILKGIALGRKFDRVL